MNRREFLAVGGVAGFASAAMAACGMKQCCNKACTMPKLTPTAQAAQLNLCLQWGIIPTADDMNAKLDYLEANGYSAIEIPASIKWLRENGMKLVDALKGRKIMLTAACGPSKFDRLDPKENDAEVERFTPILQILGEMKSTGVIICPARSEPQMGHKELREDFVNNTGKRIAQMAAKCGTNIILEPLQRRETPFLRQVSDATRMAQEIGEGCTVLGDFWHMSKEEASMFGAFVTAGKLLTHVHIASLGRRKVPGQDGELDNYVDGFRGLKFIGYRGPVSFEHGWVEKGRDAKNKPIWPTNEERHPLLVNACRILREQWEQA